MCGVWDGGGRTRVLKVAREVPRESVSASLFNV